MFLLLAPTRMKALFATGVCAMLLCSGCAPGRGQNTRLLNDWSAKCKEAADMLESVKDARSAQAASQQLATLMRELNRIDEQLQQSYDAEDVDRFDEPRVMKQAGEGIAQMQRLMAQSLRVGQDAQVRAALGEAWHLLPAAAMMEAGVEFPPVESAP